MALTIDRAAGPIHVAEEVAIETIGGLEIDPRWFGLTPEEWTVNDDTVTATLVAYNDDGEPAERFRVTLTVEPEGV